MISGHLVPPPAPGGDLRLGVGQLAGLIDRAGNRQRLERTILAAQRVDREADELVDVADVIGEEDKVLEMLGGCAGVMLEAREAEVGARGVEQSERARALGAERTEAVRDLVADV